MRIFLVVWWFDALGGMERHVTALACALAARGHSVHLFTEKPLPRANPYARQLRQANIPIASPGRFVSRQSIDDAPAPLREVMARGDYNRHTRALFRNLEVARQAAPPDIVHIHGCRLGQHWVAEWAAARALPVVYTEHTTLGDWGGPHDAEAPFAVWACAGAIACVSHASRASLESVLPAPREVRLARHIVEPQPATPEPTTALCVARLEPHKGIDVLLQALAQCKSEGLAIPLKIAGEGHARPALVALARELNLQAQVEFVGQVPPARVAALWAGCKFGVLPSRTEALPLSIVEAMSHGRPVIASGVGGIPELIHHGVNGLLVPPGDIPALAAALRRCAEQPAFTAQLGHAARASYQSGGWTEAAVVTETLATYNAAHVRPQPQPITATSHWSPVYHVTYSLAPLGDGEQRIADLLLAQQWAGAEAALILAAPLARHNRYGRLLRRAGIPVHAPGLLRIPNAQSLLAAACREKRPAAIHLHYWSNARPWPGREAIRAFAETNQIPYAETDHCHLAPIPLPADPHAKLSWLTDGSRQLHLLKHAEAAYEKSAYARR